MGSVMSLRSSILFQCAPALTGNVGSTIPEHLLSRWEKRTPPKCQRLPGDYKAQQLAAEGENIYLPAPVLPLLV